MDGVSTSWDPAPLGSSPSSSARCAESDVFVDLALAGRVFATVVEPLRDAAGTISSLIGVSTDVTSERRLEDRAAREQRERAVVELALEGLDPLLGLDAQARAIATELVDLPDVDRVSILGFGPGGLVFLFAAEGLSVPTLTAGCSPAGNEGALPAPSGPAGSVG